MVRLLFSSFLMLGLLCGTVQSQPSSELKTEMRKFKAIIDGLKPYLVDESKFGAKENEKAVSEGIRQLREQIESTAHRGYLTRDDYKTTLGMLMEHVRSTERNFDAGRKDFARYMLHSTLQTCMSCHSRLPAGTGPQIEGKLDPKSVTFSEAEFYFATRQFAEVVPVFEHLILEYPKNKLSVGDLMEALDYTATLYARILRDPAGGEKAFAAFLKKKNLPPFLFEDVQAWRSYFGQWAKAKPLAFENIKEKDIVAQVENILRDAKQDPFYLKDRANHIAFLRASGILHEFLVRFPGSKLTPYVYFLLGQTYLSLSQDFFTGVDQMYLKQCIQDFPKELVARKCYNLLEESIYLGYSGSSGTHVPFDVIQELNKYKKTVY